MKRIEKHCVNGLGNTLSIIGFVFIWLMYISSIMRLDDAGISEDIKTLRQGCLFFFYPLLTGLCVYFRKKFHEKPRDQFRQKLTELENRGMGSVLLNDFDYGHKFFSGMLIAGQVFLFPKFQRCILRYEEIRGVRTYLDERREERKNANGEREYYYRREQMLELTLQNGSKCTFEINRSPQEYEQFCDLLAAKSPGVQVQSYQ